MTFTRPSFSQQNHAAGKEKKKKQNISLTEHGLWNLKTSGFMQKSDCTFENKISPIVDFFLLSVTCIECLKELLYFWKAM